MDSPVDPLLVTASGGALTGVFFNPHKGIEQRTRVAGDGWERRDDDPVLGEARTQLQEYFAHERQVFDLPTSVAGSRFQLRVWNALSEIGYGTTRSYGDIAVRLGLPLTASRAVGRANGSNPLSVVVPCHRVIGADGSLTGFGGGAERKRFLLDLETPLLF